MFRLLSILGLGGLLAYAYSRAAMGARTDAPGPRATPQQAVNTYNQLRTGSARGVPEGLPGLPNARRLPQGYIGLAEPEGADHIHRLYELGVRCIVSLVQVGPSALAEIRRLGIRHWIEPMGADFLPRHTTALAAARAQCGPRGMAVHCTHGVDRTGSSLAWLLWRYHGFSPGEAMWSQVAPNLSDYTMLLQMLREHGQPTPPGAPGFYAPENTPGPTCGRDPLATALGYCGHISPGGGMKVVDRGSARYQHQAWTTLQAMGVR